MLIYIVHGILQARILEWVAMPFSNDRLQVVGIWIFTVKLFHFLICV